MVILHVIDSLGRGGAENLMTVLLPELQRQGVKCHVAVLYPPYCLVELLKSSGIVVHQLCISHRWNILQALFRLSRLLRSHRYDVVHAHLFFSGFYCALSKFLVSSPRRVVTFHNLDYDSYPANTVWKKLRKKFDAACNRHLISRRVAVSLAVKQHYESHLGLSDIDVIPNCVGFRDVITSFGTARANLFDRFGVKPDDFLIIMPGRLVHEKGHRFALDGLAQLKDQGLLPKLLILGDGALRSEISALIDSKGLRDQVILHPAVPQDELFHLMAGAEMILMVPTHEGWGLVAAEAMGLGKPLLATTVGGLPEVVADAVSGLMIPPADPSAVAAGIALLMNDPALRVRLGEAGRRRVRENFTPEILARRWVDYYQSLLGANHRVTL